MRDRQPILSSCIRERADLQQLIYISGRLLVSFVIDLKGPDIEYIARNRIFKHLGDKEKVRSN